MDKQHRQELLQDLDLVAIFEQIHEGFAICDADGKMLYITENMEKMFHTTVENVIGKVNDEIGIVKPAVSDRVIAEKRKISTRQENRFGEEFFITGVPIRRRRRKELGRMRKLLRLARHMDVLILTDVESAKSW